MSDSYIKFPSYHATAPSNIAFVKYWGKRDVEKQWPANDSISMTLSDSRTETLARKITGVHDTFTFAGESITSGSHPDHKVFRHLRRVREALGLTSSLAIESRNTFPTGCGIASSASGFAALTLAACAALTDESSFEGLAMRGATRDRMAHLARLGSGSAGRSLFGGIVRWGAGEAPSNQTISQEFDSRHWDLSDVIIVFSDKEKHISSSEAHLAAWGSPLFKGRLAGIGERMKVVHSAIANRDIITLGREIEADAMEMHAVAMTGSPHVTYFTEQTAECVAWVRSERATEKLPAWFTIDAGPNVHLICETQSAQDIVRRVKSRWPNALIITDRIGAGPTVKRVDAGNTSGGDAHV